MSHSRVETADDMAVDEAGVAPPSNEWMEAAQRAADTDGILENGPALCFAEGSRTPVWLTMRKEYGRSFEPCAGSQLVHATAVASASGTAAIGEVVCIGVLCDFAFGPLRRLRLEAQSGQRAATKFCAGHHALSLISHHTFVFQQTCSVALVQLISRV